MQTVRGFARGAGRRVWLSGNESVRRTDILSEFEGFEKVREEGISTAVCEFIHKQIHSLEQLEILLFLASKNGAAATVLEIFSLLQSSQASIRERLQQLKAGGLVAETGGDEFRFEPKTVELKKLVEQLALNYGERRVKVIETIYAKKQDSMESFAEAFRFRRKEP